jgi:hypothetical protein
MAWDDGLSCDGSRILIVRCGISYLNILGAAAECGTIPATARRLGVGETTLRTCISAHHLGHWFQERLEPRCPTKITRRRLLYWLRQNMTRRDIAVELGCTYEHLNVMLRRYGLHLGMPNRGAAAWRARRGQVGPAVVGLKSEGRFLWADGCNLSAV